MAVTKEIAERDSKADDRAKAYVAHAVAGMAEDGALASELEAAKRIYGAISNLEPSAAERVCQWALARRSAEAYRHDGSAGLVGVALAQKHYRGI